MADPDTAAFDQEELGGEDDTTFHTDAVQANRDIERGLGVGARELAAQRDAKGAVLDAGVEDEAEDEDDA